jgi:outer membrane protein insertion porin family
LGTPAVVFNPDRTQARLTYVIENPWVFEFKFEGNYFLSDYKIAQQLQEEKLSGAISSPAPDMADRIRRMYWAQGYANADVSVAEKLDASEHKQSLHFTIREGPRVRINKVEISGQISRPEAYYAKFLRVSSSDLIGQGFYNRKDIEDGVKRLMTELQNQGYFRAKVQSQRAEYSPDGSLVTIAIAIDEGPLTQVRQIRFEGVEAFPKAQLIEILKIKTGSALGLAELEESINALKVFYKSEGYLEMKIKNEAEQNRIVTYNEGNTQATVEFQIYEGPRVRVGTITSQGNTFTKDYVIMRELPIHSGDTLTPDKIDETIFRLQRLNLFSHVNVRMLEEGTNISERTIILEVTEKDPGTVITRLGATNERNFITLRALLGVSYNNIGGTGRGISFRAEPKYSLDPNVSYVEHILTLSYLEPFIFNDRNRGRVNLVREQLLSEFQANGQALIQEANTIGFLLERDLTRNIRLTYNTYSFSNERKFDRFSNVTTENLNIAKTGPLIEFDFRDDQWNPTKGTFSYLNLEYADPLFGSSKDDTQTINFVKINASTTNYQPILKRKDFVWVNQIRGGYLANISNDPKASIPSQEMFFLGGRSTIRGFNPGADENERIPNRYDLGNVATYSDFRLRNDSYFGLFKSELWFPIKGNIGGTLFYDGGAVIVNQPEVNQPMPYRDSVGFGIRYMTPVGPANIEIGFKLNRRVLKVATDGTSDIVEAPMALHISIGAL